MTKRNLFTFITASAAVLFLTLSFGQAAYASSFKQQYRGDRGMWIQDLNGRWWYQYDNGSYPSNTWYKDGGEWYFFESDGYMAANKWISGKDGWFYVDGSGKMLRNTTIDGKWYVNDRGAWVDPEKR